MITTPPVDDNLYKLVSPYLTFDEKSTYFLYAMLGKHIEESAGVVRVVMDRSAWDRFQGFRHEMINKYISRIPNDKVVVNVFYRGREYLLCKGDGLVKSNYIDYKEKGIENDNE